MSGVIDRFEGKIAVVEDDNGDIFNIEKRLIKGSPVEGDYIVKKGDIFYIDKEETNKRRKEANSFLDLWE